MKAEYRKASALNAYAYQYRPLDSPVHRLGAAAKLLIAAVMTALSIVADDPWQLGALFLLNLAYYRLARLRFMDLWRDTKLFLAQLIIVTGLYVIRYGGADGLWPGLRTSMQIVLFFLPSAVFLRTTNSSQLMRALRRVLPDVYCLAILASFRFIPYFVREFREIVMAQKMRGARLTARQLVAPSAWGDIMHCVIGPLIVRALKTARSAALSAEVRGFGGTRTARLVENRLKAGENRS